MDELRAAAEDFLSQRRIAVVGVSREGDSAANPVYRRLREKGYEVFPVNPHADEVEGDPCLPSVGEIPGGVDGVVVATHPAVSADVARECVAAGVPRVWFHRSFGTGSVSDEAVAVCEQAGLRVMAGACPMMFLEPVDFGHRCMRWILDKTGKLPEPTGRPTP
ncbi:MAG: CoA-binding protein [Gemmatimonadota bacterium]|jgi:predicted CoA-binding protein